MKKTATLIALAGLSMAAKTEHSFLGRKPVEISSEIDPKMVIRPRDNIDPGMVRKPTKNIDKGIFVKPKRPQGTISADDNDDELLLVFRPSDKIDPKMVIRPRDNIDPGMVIKPKKTQGTILVADDADDELLSIYRPYGYDIDSGMVRRPPYGYDIDPKMVIKPPKEFQNIDNGIFVRPQVRPATIWTDDEMRVISGTEVDPGMVIKPRRGDIDPRMIRKPAKGWEIDPKIFVKPKRGDVVYADDDELAYISAKQVREPRLIGDFPTKPWPGAPVYADAEDDELAIIGVSDQGIPNKGVSHDDELMYQRLPTAVSDLGIRPMGHLNLRDDELAVFRNRTKPLVGDFPINWPGMPVYADDEDNELADQMTDFVREPRIIGDHGKSADDELVYASNRFDQGMVRRPHFDNIDQGMIRRPRSDIKYLDAENDDELAVFRNRTKPYIGDFPINWPGKPVYADDEDNELVALRNRTKPLVGDFPINWPGKPIYADAEDDELVVVRNRTKPLVGDFPINWPGKPIYADAEDDELIMFADYSLDRPRRGVFDPKELTKPWYQQQQVMYADDTADDELAAEIKKPWKKIEGQEEVLAYKGKDDADDELIMFADKSLDARLERRRVPFDLKELTKPWYQQQQTMYADDSLVALGELLEDN